jgi:replicative DNA helicase
MPEHDLVLRAERALLGAVLREPHQLEQVSYLPTAAFTHPTHQAIYQYLRETYQGQQPPRPDQLPQSVAPQLRIPGVDADYLRSVAAACPDPDHATIYARMLQEAHVRVTLASFANNIAAENPTDQRLQRYNDVLGRALARQGYTLTDTAREELAPAVTTTRTTGAGTDQPPADERARREELVLADLLQHQRQIAEVQTWLSPQAFAPGVRRELYETIVTVDGYGEPVTEMTIEWELSRRRYQPQPEATQTYTTTDPDNALNRPDVAPQYLERLLTTAVAVGTAVELGGDLLAETLRADLSQRTAKALANVHLGQGATAEHTAVHLAPKAITPTNHVQQQTPGSPTPQLLPPPPTAVPVPNQPKPRM